MHLVGPMDKEGHDNFLCALGRVSFDQVLAGLGKHFKFKHLQVFQMSFIAVTHSIEPYWLWDFHDTGGKTCNFIIPLFVVDETPTALLIHGNTDSDDDDEWGDIFEVQYEVGLGELIGNGLYHVTGKVDYRDLPNSPFRMAATIYLAEIDEENVERVYESLTSVFQSTDDKEHSMGILLNHTSHWDIEGITKLPT